MEKLKYKDYPEKTYIEIEGINYSYDFFKMIGNEMLLNQPFIIVERKNKTVTIEKIKPNEKQIEKKARELIDLFHRWKEEHDELPLYTAKNIVRQIQFSTSIY